MIYEINICYNISKMSSVFFLKTRYIDNQLYPCHVNAGFRFLIFQFLHIQSLMSHVDNIRYIICPPVIL